MIYFDIVIRFGQPFPVDFECDIRRALDIKGYRRDGQNMVICFVCPNDSAFANWMSSTYHLIGRDSLYRSIKIREYDPAKSWVRLETVA